MGEKTNNSIDYIFGRRSIRVYKDIKVSEEKIDLLLKAGMAAPSACFKDPWRFIVIRDKETLNKMASGMPAGKMLPSASVAFVVCGNVEEAFDKQIGFMVQDCSAAIQNILLAAHSIELGACWLALYPKEQRMQHISEIFSLPDNIIPICCIAIGYPDEVKESRTRYNKDYVYYEKYTSRP